MVSVEADEANYTRSLDFEVDRLDPILILAVAVFGSQLAQFTPRRKIIVGELSLFDIDDLRGLPVQQDEGAASSDNSDRM